MQQQTALIRFPTGIVQPNVLFRKTMTDAGVLYFV